EARGVAVDADGNAYVAGRTLDRTLPVTALSFEPLAPSGSAGFAAKIEFTPPQVFALTSVKPRAGGDTGLVTIRIFGTRFPLNPSAFLTRTGLPALQATAAVLAPDGRSLVARFDLRGQALGSRDVVVSGDGGQATLTLGFEIVSGRAPSISPSIIG